MSSPHHGRSPLRRFRRFILVLVILSGILYYSELLVRQPSLQISLDDSWSQILNDGTANKTSISSNGSPSEEVTYLRQQVADLQDDMKQLQEQMSQLQDGLGTLNLDYSPDEPEQDGEAIQDEVVLMPPKSMEAVETKNAPPKVNPPAKTQSVVEFEHQEGVVIATKVHGHHHIPLLEQSLCLLHHAYNNRTLYDIVVFTTTTIHEYQLRNLRSLVAPANLTVVKDNNGLKEEIRALTPTRRANFLKSCKVTSPENLTWWSDCPGRIAYNWQAEFRSWPIWRHRALRQYQWMMWLDSDAFCTKVWDRDPIKVMLENNLVILFDNMMGAHGGKKVHKRIFPSFGNRTLCSIKLEDGRLFGKVGGYKCFVASLRDIHGFFHITKLDFYRQDIVHRFQRNWIGDGFLQREYDDQAAVTIPAAMLAPSRAWDMRSHGLNMSVYHNFRLDGKWKEPKGGFFSYWANTVQHQFPGAVGVCPITNKD